MSLAYLLRILIFSVNREFMENEILLTFSMGMNLIDIISFIFTLYIQYILFSKGQHFVRSIIRFSSYFVYFGLVIFLMLITEHFQDVIKSVELSLNYKNFFSKSNIAPLITVTGTLFAFYSIIILNFGDFSRYVKSNDQLIKGNLSLILNFILFSLFAILIILAILIQKMWVT